MDAFKFCTWLWAVVAAGYLALEIVSRATSSPAAVREPEKREPGGTRLIYVVCLAAGIWLIFYAQSLQGFPRAALYRASSIKSWACVGVTAVGIGFAIWARTVIGTNWSGAVLIKRGHELIVTGPYAVVRHPTYAGFILALTGTVLALDEWRGVAGWIFIVGSFLWKVAKEELMLSAIFPQYRGYQKRTARLIPFIC